MINNIQLNKKSQKTRKTGQITYTQTSNTKVKKLKRDLNRKKTKKQKKQNENKTGDEIPKHFLKIIQKIAKNKYGKSQEKTKKWLAGNGNFFLEAKKILRKFF